MDKNIGFDDLVDNAVDFYMNFAIFMYVNSLKLWRIVTFFRIK